MTETSQRHRRYHTSDFFSSHITSVTATSRRWFETFDAIIANWMITHRIHRAGGHRTSHRSSYRSSALYSPSLSYPTESALPVAHRTSRKWKILLLLSRLFTCWSFDNLLPFQFLSPPFSSLQLPPLLPPLLLLSFTTFCLTFSNSEFAIFFTHRS